MKKRRITLNLSEEVIEALEAIGGKSLSVVADDALSEALASRAHRAALRGWLDELDAQHGAPDSRMLAAADALLDTVEQGSVIGSHAA
ncbi:MAG: hypothetical protein ACRD3Q_02160 [Terriglobales bacterium]